MEKLWVLREVDENLVADFTKELKISQVLARILISRGIDTFDKANVFLHPDLAHMHNPFLLPDIDKAIARIKRAIKNEEHIHVFGDRDVDGLTSTTIAVDFLHKMKAHKVTYTVPSGDMGYGLSNAAIDMISNLGASLIITVDCGITNGNEIEYAKSKGIDVIVTDHHEPQGDIPQCVAVIDPKREDSPYPFNELAGVGVIFKTMLAYALSNAKDYDKEYVVFDLETTGFNPYKEEIIEIGAVKLKNGLEIDQFQAFVKPSKHIPHKITTITNITDDMVKDAGNIREVLPKFVEFVGDSTLVGHNIGFDLSFVQHNMPKIGKKSLKNKHFDTLTYARDYYPGVSHALENLAPNLGISLEGAHRAINDARATSKLFLRLKAKSDIYKINLKKKYISSYIELVALGTIADLVPLIDENRILAHYGLKFLGQTKRPGLKVLLKSMDLYKQQLKSEHISWKISPLLNSAGRMQQADIGAELLLSKTESEAENALNKITDLNNKRKNLSKVNTDIVESILPQQANVEKDSILILYTDQIEHGVTGIIANKIMRAYMKPVIILIIQDGVALGAGRAPDGFDLIRILEQCSDLLEQFGGHTQAVGLTLKEENIVEFIERAKKYAEEQTKGEKVVPEIVIDSKVKLEDINSTFLKEAYLLEPMGFSNPTPVFLTEQVMPASAYPVGADKSHLKLRFNTKDNTYFDGIAFNLAYKVKEHLKDLSNLPVDVVYNLGENRFRNKVTHQLQIRDLEIRN